jgi:hypothetical protein
VLIVLKSGSLNLLEPYGPVQACNGIVLPLPLPSLKLGGDGEDRIKIMPVVEEVRMDFCHCLERKELIHRLIKHQHQYSG